MKILNSILFSVIFFMWYNPAIAEENILTKKFYLGASGIYAIQNFGKANATQNEIDYSNAPGFSLKTGYWVHNDFAIELNYEWISGFDWKGNTSSSGGLVFLTTSTDVSDLMLSLKFSPKGITTTNFKPFLLYGAGLMSTDRKVSASIPMFGIPASESNSSKNGLSMKAGFGFDYFISDGFALNFEGAYKWANGDINTIKYFDISAGALLFF